MTVSPRWPQDGNRPPRDVAGGADTSDSYRSPALPPTLFQLPNLNTASAQPTKPKSEEPLDANPVSEVPPVEAPPVEPTGENEGQGSTAAGTENGVTAKDRPVTAEKVEPQPADAAPAANQPGTRNSDTVSVVDSASTDPKSSDSDERPPRTPPPPAVTANVPLRQAPVTDRPAGRSWMDSVASHGVVVVLLLVVVAAALVTGRNSGDGETLAEQSDLLNFDDSNRIELPIPDHGTVAELTETTEPSEQVDLPTVEEMMAASDVMSAAPQTDPADLDVALSELPADTQPNADAVATLDLPEPGQALGQDVADSAALDQIRANRVQVNEFVTTKSETDFRAASNRVPAEDGSSTLPGLEDLSRQQASPNTSASTPVQKGRPLVSNTPKQLGDLTQYLPPLPAAPATEAEPTEPSDIAIPTSSE